MLLQRNDSPLHMHRSLAQRLAGCFCCSPPPQLRDLGVSGGLAGCRPCGAGGAWEAAGAAAFEEESQWLSQWLEGNGASGGEGLHPKEAAGEPLSIPGANPVRSSQDHPDWLQGPIPPLV